MRRARGDPASRRRDFLATRVEAILPLREAEVAAEVRAGRSVVDGATVNAEASGKSAAARITRDNIVVESLALFQRWEKGSLCV